MFVQNFKQPWHIKESDVQVFGRAASKAVCGLKIVPFKSVEAVASGEEVCPYCTTPDPERRKRIDSTG